MACSTLDQCFVSGDVAFDADPDIAGIGIIIAFFIPAITAWVLALFWLFSGLVDSSQLTTFDCNILMIHDAKQLRDTPKGKRYPLVSTEIHLRLVNRAENLRLSHAILAKVMLILRDQQLVTGIAMLLIGFIKTCSITQYHFLIITDLAWLSSSVCLAADFIVRPNEFENPWSRHFRFGSTMLMLSFLVVTEVISWNENFVANSGILGLPMICCWSPRISQSFDPNASAVIQLIILLWNILVELNLYHPDAILTKFINRCIAFAMFVLRLPIGIQSWTLHQTRTRLDEFRQEKSFSSYQKAVRSFLKFVCVCLFLMLLTNTSVLFVVSFAIAELVESQVFEMLRLSTIIAWSISNVVWWRAYAAGIASGNENEWGFGQMLPVMLLILPGFTLGEAIYDCRHMKQRGEVGVEAGIGRILSGLKGITGATPRVKASNETQLPTKLRGGEDDHIDTEVLPVAQRRMTSSDKATGFVLEEAMYGNVVGQFFLAIVVPGGALGGLMYGAIEGFIL